MRKKNGFIATSLLYSFFLVFCALIVGLIGTVLHNRRLLNNVTNNIKNDLSEIDKRTLGKVEVGSYVTIPVFSSDIKITTENIKWIVASKDTNNKTVTLVSDSVVMMSNNYMSYLTLQENLNHYFNLYTSGSSSMNYMTYLTKEDITSFERMTDLILKKALLSVDTEYFYYDKTTAQFYLYKYTCDQKDVCSVNKNQKIATNDTKQYGLKIVMKVSDNTPISVGSGVLNNPYDILYYVHKKDNEEVLKLHYDNINSNGNLGFKTGLNTIKDLSGNNEDGILLTGTYANNINNGATISTTAGTTLNTNLNIHQIVTSTDGFTIEFRALNNLRFGASPNYMADFLNLVGNATIRLNTTNYATGVVAGSFNTYTIVKRPGTAYLRVYVNGKLISANVTIATLSVAANNILYIGGSGLTEIFKSIRVYNTALTDAEIIHNHNVDERWRIV